MNGFSLSGERVFKAKSRTFQNLECSQVVHGIILTPGNVLLEKLSKRLPWRGEIGVGLFGYTAISYEIIHNSLLRDTGLM